jgi:hypothetical protein
MIQHSYPEYKDVYFRVIEGPKSFEIQTLEVFDPKAFSKGQTILINRDNPNLLWDVLHGLISFPYPQLNNEQKKDPEIRRSARKKIRDMLGDSPAPEQELEIIRKELSEPPHFVSSLEKELMALSAKNIIKKVEQERGILITNSLKSKAAIIKKVLKIYLQ